MINISPHLRINIVILHVFLGIAAAYSPLFAFLWASLFLLYSIVQVIKTANATGWAHNSAAYLVGIEVLLRICDAPLPYEFGKYSVSFIFILGLIVEKKKQSIPLFAVMYMIMLLPSIAVARYADFFDARTAISFNLSGPLSLAVACIYFYNRVIDKDGFSRMIYFLILPVLSMIVAMIVRLPNLAEIKFTSESNDALTGGFGPNQVSTILGAAFFMVFLGWLLNFSITGKRGLDSALGAIFFGYSLFTFSRGGAVAGVGAALIAMFVMLRAGESTKQLKRVFKFSVISTVVLLLIVVLIDNISNSALSERYGETIYGKNYKLYEAGIIDEQKGLEFSGRDKLVSAEFEIFFENPILGVGPGAGIYLRGAEVDKEIMVAHTEFTRLLAEHGIYGVTALIILIINPLRLNRKVSPVRRILLFSFTFIAFVTMSHSAMRLAVVGFTFGLAFINYTETLNHPLQRKLSR
ncbi:MAG: O-antigen ligase family protein [Bacteroidota bacterium]|nr:O-antigen ligase family protein [Bacteroidota bacterium]